MLARIAILSALYLLSSSCVFGASPAPSSICAGSFVDTLPEVVRGQIAPAVDEKTVTIKSTDPQPTSYRALAAIEAQCLAAANSALGNLFSNERNSVQSAGGLCHREDRVAALKRRILSYAAAEERNRSAGDSLTAYYRLAEAEGRHDLLHRARVELQTAVEELDRLAARGVTVPSSTDSLRTRQNETAKTLADVNLAVSKLNGTLRQLTGATRVDARMAFWPVAELKVTSTAIDVEAEVAYGLAIRPELNLLRTMERELDAETLPAVRQALAGVNGLLGGASGSRCACLGKLIALVCSCNDEAEVDARRRQIRRYRFDRELAVAEEIRQAAFAIETRLAQIALANEQLRRASEELREVEPRRRAGRATFIDVITDQLAVGEAQGALLSSVVDWEIARAQLRQAQGALIEECAGTGMCH